VPIHNGADFRQVLNDFTTFYPRPTDWYKTIAHPVFVEKKRDDYAADAR
jgi:hypothetical protein